MARTKGDVVRAYLLDALEGGVFREGDKIPGARDIAKELGVSFLKVQQALEVLCSDGILHTVGRKGTYVQKNWRQRILPENITLFNPHASFLWLDGFMKIMHEEFPEARFTSHFAGGSVEMKTTLHVQLNWKDYIDLSDLLDECCPDRDEFFTEVIDGFRINDRLVGIPFCFSPRVVFYNPEVFRECGCPLPSEGWHFSDLLEIAGRLKKVLSPENIINWGDAPFLWMTYVARAGGRVMDDSLADPVLIDSPETQLGLRCCQQLGDIVGPVDHIPVKDNFAAGKAAMYVGERQSVNFFIGKGFDSWETIKLPVINENCENNLQGTDLLCIHKSCCRPDVAREYIKFMLSAKAQDYIAAAKYGIPLRKSSAFKSLDLTQPRDSLFAVEIPNMVVNYNVRSPGLADIIFAGVSRILAENLPIEKSTRALAEFVRQYLDMKKYSV